MQSNNRWTQWKRLLVVVPFATLGLMSAGWVENRLRPLHLGMDTQLLDADSRYMGKIFESKGQGGEKGFIHIDLADESQYRFVLNRLAGAGKTAENAPFLFQRLVASRQRALARQPSQESTASLTSEAWGCEHYVTLSPGKENTTTQLRPYQSGPVGTCQGGANYIYTDILFHNSDLTGTNRVLLASNAGEQYGGGTNFTLVEVNPNMPLTTTQQVDVDSMMIAMNDTTGEEVITFVRALSGSTQSPATITLNHPSFAAETKPNISLCQLRGGDDCDYAVVSNQNGVLVPWFTAPAGVAQRQSKTPWRGNLNAFFPFNNGVGFDTQHVFVPLSFTFDAGAGTTACSIMKVLPNTKARLVKNSQGGQCGTEEAISTELATGARATSFNRLLNFNRNTTVVQSGSANCTMARITNENVELTLSVYVEASCGRVKEVRSATYRSLQKWNWRLYVLNSCMAAGTGIELADGDVVPVEAVRVGSRVVANNDGLVLTVTDVQRGGEDKPLVHLRDDKGHDVRLTTEHPVVLSSGKVVKAEVVKVKDRISTRTGESTVVAVTRVPYDGQVYNLTLGTPEELAQVSKEDRTLFAGGIQVGDSSIQFDLTAPRQATVDVLTRLPKTWHQDFKKRLALR
jgi:hypothetical protein